MRRRFVFRALSLLLTAPYALASTLTVSESGTFANGTPTTAVSAAGASFSYSFLVASNPTVSAVQSGSSFNPTISNFSYTLNGVTSTPAVGSITVFSLADAGLFDICFVTACDGTNNPDLGLGFTGQQQIYSGSEANPTLLTGVLAPTPQDSFFYNTDGTFYAVNAGPITVTATPEPSSIALLGTGLLAVSGYLRRRGA